MLGGPTSTNTPRLPVAGLAIDAGGTPTNSSEIPPPATAGSQKTLAEQLMLILAGKLEEVTALQRVSELALEAISGKVTDFKHKFGSLNATDLIEGEGGASTSTTYDDSPDPLTSELADLSGTIHNALSTLSQQLTNSSTSWTREASNLEQTLDQLAASAHTTEERFFARGALAEVESIRGAFGAQATSLARRFVSFVDLHLIGADCELEFHRLQAVASSFAKFCSEAADRLTHFDPQHSILGKDVADLVCGAFEKALEIAQPALSHESGGFDCDPGDPTIPSKREPPPPDLDAPPHPTAAYLNLRITNGFELGVLAQSVQSRGVLEELLVALFTNAIEASADQESDRVISCEIGTNPAQDELYVAVVDSGPGIPEELLGHDVNRPRIFDPGFSTHPEREPTGASLSDVFILMTRLGGTLVASNIPHGGACLEARLPLFHPGKDNGLNHTSLTLATPWPLPQASESRWREIGARLHLRPEVLAEYLQIESTTGFPQDLGNLSVVVLQPLIEMGQTPLEALGRLIAITNKVGTFEKYLVDIVNKCLVNEDAERAKEIASAVRETMDPDGVARLDRAFAFLTDLFARYREGALPSGVTLKSPEIVPLVWEAVDCADEIGSIALGGNWAKSFATRLALREILRQQIGPNPQAA